MIKRFLGLSVLLAMLWGCCSVEDIPATEEKTASYKVEHYQQNTNDDGYTLVKADSENKNGKTGENTSVQAKTYEGFTAKTVEQVKITADGKAVVKIYYDRNEITLTLDLDGGEGENEIIGKYGATVNVTAPTKSGYDFASWNPELPTTFPAESATYTAQWAKEGDYVITYNLNGGTNASDNPASYNVENATITLADATKTGYTFGGWYTDEACTETNKVTEIKTGSTGNLTLYAKWIANTDTAYKVEHYQQNANDDDYTLVEADTEYKTGTTDEDTSAQAKTYENFTAQEVKQVKIAADGKAVVKIYYDRNIITLKLNLDGGSGETEIKGKYGAKVTKPTDPTKSGYQFSGWEPTLPDTFPAEDPDYEYEAKWVQIVSITYELNGGNWIDGFTPKDKCERGEDIYLPTAENIEKAGCNFDGWLRGKRIITEILDSTSDVTVTAQWLEIYAITYDLDGGINAESNPKEYTKKSETITLADATKTGYTFGGWYTDEAFTEESKVTQIEKGSTGNITLYAQWTANKVGITVILPNDAQINLQQVTNENIVTFTAADSFDSYAWYIDGVKQIDTSNAFTIDTSTIESANYKVMVVVSFNDEYYSAVADLEVRTN